MTALCKIILESTSSLWACMETTNGARVRTTCVFPSFEPVFVYVAKLGDGFVVHDAGEAMAIIMSHGQAGDAAKRTIRSECKRFDVAFSERRISLKIDAAEWLETAIVAVANTAATAARNALKDNNIKAERDLADVIFHLLEPKLAKGTITKDFPFLGESGRRYRFDLAIQGKEQLTLIEIVSRHANSVNSKYVALADVPSDAAVKKIVAHNNDLSQEDILLLQNVATVAGPNGVMDLVAGRLTKH
ncbi:hypothetical protein MCEREM30_01146 [Paracoccaceae bacterium]